MFNKKPSRAGLAWLFHDSGNWPAEFRNQFFFLCPRPAFNLSLPLGGVGLVLKCFFIEQRRVAVLAHTILEVGRYSGVVFAVLLDYVQVPHIVSVE